MRKRIAVASFLFTLLITIFARIEKTYAWGPITHIYVCERAIQEIEREGSTSELYRIIIENYEWFKCGLMYPDVTVIYYYTNWTSYKFTHSWFRQNQAWEEAKKAGSRRAMAFALGWGAHLIQDCIAHNLYVPEKIRRTLVQNNIIHPVVEGIVETKIINPNVYNFPQGEEMAISAFNEYNHPFNDGTSLSELSPVEFAEKVTGAPPEFKAIASQFHNILSGGGFGVSSFKGYSFGQQRGWMWEIYHGVAKVFAYALRDDDPDLYIRTCIDVTKRWILNGDGGRPQDTLGISNFDPTGDASLKSADAYVVNFTILIVVATVLVIGVYYYRRYKKR